MIKPKPYIHFTDSYDTGACVHIGKFVLPLGVFFVGYGLTVAFSLVVFGIISGVTGNPAWMFGSLYILGSLVGLCVVALLVTLIAWMVRYTKRVNR